MTIIWSTNIKAPIITNNAPTDWLTLIWLFSTNQHHHSQVIVNADIIVIDSSSSSYNNHCHFNITTTTTTFPSERQVSKVWQAASHTFETDSTKTTTTNAERRWQYYNITIISYWQPHKFIVINFYYQSIDSFIARQTNRRANDNTHINVRYQLVWSKRYTR